MYINLHYPGINLDSGILYRNIDIKENISY